MGHKLTSKQIKAIYLMASGATTVDIGKKLKMRRQTLWNWRQKPHFNAEFDRVMNEMCKDIETRIKRLVSESVTNVSYGMGSNFCEPQRIRASLAVLKMLGLERLLIQKPTAELGNDTEKLPN